MKKEIRFHWFYHYKERYCDGCEKLIEKGSGRYVDYRERKYYCRTCAGLIVMGVDYGKDLLTPTNVEITARRKTEMRW